MKKFFKRETIQNKVWYDVDKDIFDDDYYQETSLMWGLIKRSYKATIKNDFKNQKGKLGFNG